jgi:hypothetical protein
MPEEIPRYTSSGAKIEHLHLDPKNPRLPSDKVGATDAEILRWMITQGDLLELAAAIASQGYFPGEPLLVAPTDAPEGAVDPPAPNAVGGLELTVVEGNRRLAAVLMLRNPELAPAKAAAFAGLASAAETPLVSEIPVIVFAHRRHILRYLGFRHVKGVKEWKPLEKARYLKEMRDLAVASGGDASDLALAKRIGSKADYVARLLATLEVLSRVEEHVQEVAFSLLTTAFSYASIRAWVGLDFQTYPGLAGLKQDRLEKLAEWLFARPDGSRPKIGESRNLRYLGAIVETPDAIAAFDAGATPAQAAMLSQSPDRIVPAAVQQAHQPLELAHKSLPEVTLLDAAVANMARACAGFATAIADKSDELQRTT